MLYIYNFAKISDLQLPHYTWLLSNLAKYRFESSQITSGKLADRAQTQRPATRESLVWGKGWNSKLVTKLPVEV